MENLGIWQSCGGKFSRMNNVLERTQRFAREKKGFSTLRSRFRTVWNVLRGRKKVLRGVGVGVNDVTRFQDIIYIEILNIFYFNHFWNEFTTSKNKLKFPQIFDIVPNQFHRYIFFHYINPFQGK